MLSRNSGTALGRSATANTTPCRGVILGQRLSLVLRTPLVRSERAVVVGPTPALSLGGGSNGPPPASGNSRGDGPGDGNGDGPIPRWALSAAAIAAHLICAGVASAKKKEEKDTKEVISETVDVVWGLIGPMVENLGFSGLIGLASGFAFKVVGKMLAVTVGLAFAFLQVMAYQGFITLHWSHMQEKVEAFLDQDGDADFDTTDVKLLMKNGLTVLSSGLPSVAGFCAGFLLGVKM